MTGDESFAADLFRKYAHVRRIEDTAKVNVSAVTNEVKRQVKQVSRRNLGNPITGEGVTKSGSED
ncbi:MAG TPA: hypothetical protein VNA13_02335 [Xanthomonadales bacterium]|nr:hypothetical protein [Xanthomonadales bacterium]